MNAFTDEQWKRLNEQLEISDNRIDKKIEALEKRISKHEIDQTSWYDTRFSDKTKEIENIKTILRDSIDFSNLLLELFLDAEILDEENHQRCYKEIKDMLEKLDVGSARQTEKKGKHYCEICNKNIGATIEHAIVHLDCMMKLIKKTSGGENSQEYRSSVEGGESIHIASPNDSKLPELDGTDDSKTYHPDQSTVKTEAMERKDCLYWTNHKCSYFQNEPLNIGLLNCKKCSAYKPKTEPEKSDALDALLHAVAPIPLPEVNKLLKETRKELIEEFLIDFFWSHAFRRHYDNTYYERCICKTTPSKFRKWVKKKWQGRLKQ